ncbi:MULTISPECIES: hypothetical protein [Sphingosinicellaceae]|uniref:hypothetical protein n=1 Tax=Sphingosinicellaceae TaxID=2820280 RepID=UPI001C1E0F62|nr:MULTISPECIES: hypothetical protein [Polymorphobacter]QYE35624.1 hypothetical protein KZX46_06515 [Polymorphobacter sp. PAMC 29334]UAJ11008.1 hypothetical protein KTC28_04660 [Polymorphobacter megasporae]
MCSLCGVLGGAEHWADAHDRPGTFTRNTGPVERRRERARRIAHARRILGPFGLELADWNGAAFLLSTRTGRTEIVDTLGHLWIVVETLLGHPADPLANAFDAA